jgi:hypothetical protein
MNISDITNLEEELASKAEAVHTHPTSDITGLVEALAGKAEVDHQHDIADFPDFTDAVGNFAPLSHTHTTSQITDLGTALAGKANLSHTHAMSAVTGLTAALAGKAGTAHEHEIEDVDGLQNALNAKSDNGHGHTIAQVTGLSDALDGKANASHFHEISQITGLEAALESATPVNANWDSIDSTSPEFIFNKPALGTAALLNVGTAPGTVAAGEHTHSASDIVSGVLPLSVIPVIPGSQTIVVLGGLADLTTEEMDLIVSGSNVVTLDGRRFVYSGTGDKKEEASYILVGSANINYSEITNTPGNATTLSGGLMSAADKAKLDGVAAGANAYVHPITDGNLHVRATGTTNNGKVLKAGASPGVFDWGTLNASEVGAAASTHAHGNLTNNGRIGSVGGLPVVTGDNGELTVGTTSTYAPGNHSHGNLTNDGKVGSTPNRLLVTGAEGTVTALSSSGTSGQVLTSGGGGQPSWSTPTTYVHPTGDGDRHVPATGTSNNGRVLTAGASPGVFSWQPLPSSQTQTTVANLSGGNTGSLPYQSSASTTTFLASAAVPNNDSQNQPRHSILRSGGSGQAPQWMTAGSIITKNQGEYVATDATTGVAGSITRITRITAAAYAVATKDPTTLYVVVG